MTMPANSNNDQIAALKKACPRKDVRIAKQERLPEPIISRHSTNYEPVYCSGCFSLSPRILLVIIVLIGFLTGNFFYAWPSTHVLYLRSGAYEWLCEGLDNNRNAVSLDSDAIYELACSKQIQAIDSLMPTGVASMFILAFFGGLSVDYFGPKISGLMGLGFQISGWVLLSFCNERFPCYLIANVLMGFGNDPMYIACLDSSKLFPSVHQGTVIGLISASRSLSFILPTIFNYILSAYPEYLTVRIVYLSYVAVLVHCFLVVLFIFPWSGFPDKQQQPRDEKGIPGSAVNFLWARSGCNSDNGRVGSVSGNRCDWSDASFLSMATSVGSAYSLSSQFRPSRVLTPSGSSSVRSRDNSLPVTSVETSASDYSLWSVVSSGLYLPLLPIASTTILSGTFFANSCREQLGPALTFFIILTPLSFLPGVFMGYLTDRYGPLFVMCILYILSLFQFTLLILKDVSFIPAWTAAVASFLVLACFLSQFYCYVALTFPRRYFGSLSGFVVMFSGLLSLIVTPMCDFSSFASNYLPMNGLCLALTSTNIFFLYVLYNARSTGLATVPFQVHRQGAVNRGATEIQSRS